jgi:hypothetical protein
MMDESQRDFFWIPDFRHIFPIFDTLYGRPFVFHYTFLKVTRKFAPPANVPGKGPAEKVELSTQQFLKKLIMVMIEICIAGPNRRAGYATVYMFVLVLVLALTSRQTANFKNQYFRKNKHALL